MAAQEYDFTITYHKGTDNLNADALSRQFEHLDVHSATTTVTCQFIGDVKLQQHQDPTICQLYNALSLCSMPPCTHTWLLPPLSCYHQLWHQLLITDDVVCRHYTPRPTSEPLTVPIIPSSYHSILLHQHHDHPQAGHLGPDKTAAKIRQVGYCVGMLHDITEYCKNCSVCQASKQPSPQKAPLINMPVGKPLH